MHSSLHRVAMRLTQLVQAAGGAPSEASSSSSSPGGGPPPPPAPDAKARAASAAAAAKISGALGSAVEDLDAVPPGAAEAKPFTVPPGWKAPTLGEQFRYVSGSCGWVHAGARWAHAGLGRTAMHRGRGQHLGHAGACLFEGEHRLAGTAWRSRLQPSAC